MISLNLTPCPFCGGTFLSLDGCADFEWVRCDTCQTTGPEAPKGHAAALWNERAQIKPQSPEPAPPVEKVEAPPPAETLTATQARVVRFVADHITGKSRAPTLREIGEALNIKSTNGVMAHLVTIKRRGFLTWEPKLSRTLALTDAGRAWIEKGRAA